MNIVGIDPGMSGALCFLTKDHLDTDWLDVLDMPTMGEGKQHAVDCANLADLFEKFRAGQPRPITAFVESVTAMKGWGSGSVFRFGQSFGSIIGVLGALQIAMHLVTPQKWKKHFGLKGGDKESSRRLVIERYPGFSVFFRRKLDHNRAEAALLAAYGRHVLQQQERS